jgi:hypothetical protein
VSPGPIETLRDDMRRVQENIAQLWPRLRVLNDSDLAELLEPIARAHASVAAMAAVLSLSKGRDCVDQDVIALGWAIAVHFSWSVGEAFARAARVDYAIAAKRGTASWKRP